MSLMPAERNELDEMARVNGMGDSAFAAMVYRKGLAAQGRAVHGLIAL